MAGWRASQLLVLVAMACALAGCGGGGPDPTGDQPTDSPPPTVAATTPATATASPTATATSEPTAVPRVTLAAVGDIMLARSIAGHVSEADPGGPFAHVREVLLGADLTIGNLECAVAAAGSPEAGKTYTFRAPPLAAEGLADAGFDVVALANNHTLDYGAEALLETVELLEAAGVAGQGAGADEAAAFATVYLERQGLTFAFLSFSDVPVEAGRERWAAGPGKPGIAWWDDSTSAQAIGAAAAEADHVVVLVHFGIEYAATPSARQRGIARAAVDAGAALVVGTHPHVLQELEEYGGGLIAYSLGNFVFDGFSGDSNRSAILHVTFGPGGVDSWEMVQVAIGGDGLPRLAGP